MFSVVSFSQSCRVFVLDEKLNPLVTEGIERLLFPPPYFYNLEQIISISPILIQRNTCRVREATMKITCSRSQ